jgi:hypothetical protein
MNWQFIQVTSKFNQTFYEDSKIFFQIFFQIFLLTPPIFIQHRRLNCAVSDIWVLVKSLRTELPESFVKYSKNFVQNRRSNSLRHDGRWSPLSDRLGMPSWI